MLQICKIHMLVICLKHRAFDNNFYAAYKGIKLDKRIVIIVPYYTNDLIKQERISLEQIKKVFCDRDIKFVAPRYLENTISTGEDFVYFDSHFFDGREGYNSLMLSTMFYNAFKEYEYILICQMDVFVLEDNLDYFCDMGYDYIGAPWIKGVKAYEENGYRVCYVGNGGLSLRKVNSMIDFTSKYHQNRFFWEDNYIASYNNILNIAPLDVAIEFAFESNIRECYEKKRKWPMGIHGWWRYDLSLIKHVIEEEGYDVSDINDERNDYNNKRIAFRKFDFDEKNIKQIILKQISNSSDRIILWGAGYHGDIIGWVLRRLDIDFECYIDVNANDYSNNLHGKKIVSSIDYIEQINCATWIICVEKFYREIKEELLRNGVNEESIISYKSIESVIEE